jgi:hypothetical protein
MAERLRFRKKQQPYATVHEQVRQHNYDESMRRANTVLQTLSSMRVCDTQADMVWVAYPAGGGHVSID